jgi:hypothetical protein
VLSILINGNEKRYVPCRIKHAHSINISQKQQHGHYPLCYVLLNQLFMNTNFKVSNFAIWCKIAIYISRNDKLIIPNVNDKEMTKKRKYLSNMESDGYLERKKYNSLIQKDVFQFITTEKFKQEFKEKYCEISKKIRPDFSDEIRNRMLSSFNF